MLAREIENGWLDNAVLTFGKSDRSADVPFIVFLTSSVGSHVRAVDGKRRNGFFDDAKQAREREIARAAALLRNALEGMAEHVNLTR